jgi:hypothetical protein
MNDFDTVKPGECCGILCTTKFCPQCGREQTIGLAGLLRHCRNQQKSQMNWVGRFPDRKGFVRMHDKWKRWADALEELMRVRECRVRGKGV